jgi:hypothetical protein
MLAELFGMGRAWIIFPVSPIKQALPFFRCLVCLSFLFSPGGGGHRGHVPAGRPHGTPATRMVPQWRGGRRQGNPSRDAFARPADVFLPPVR